MVYRHYSPKEIRILRKLLRISPEELANMVGVTRQTIYNVEKERTNSIPTLIALTVVLDDICEKQRGMKGDEYLEITYHRAEIMMKVIKRRMSRIKEEKNE